MTLCYTKKETGISWLREDIVGSNERICQVARERNEI